MNFYNFNTNEISEIKTLIFDFDGTLYSSKNMKLFYHNYIKQSLMDLGAYSCEKADKIITDFGFDADGDNRISFRNNCEKFGIKREEWDVYKIDHFFQIDYNDAETVDNNIYKALHKKYKMFIVSHEVIDNLIYKSNKMKIDLSAFDRIFAPDRSNVLTYKKKAFIYDYIKADYGISYRNMVVFGDRYKVDILPLTERGGKGVLVNDTAELTNVLKMLI